MLFPWYAVVAGGSSEARRRSRQISSACTIGSSRTNGDADTFKVLMYEASFFASVHVTFEPITERSEFATAACWRRNRHLDCGSPGFSVLECSGARGRADGPLRLSGRVLASSKTIAPPVTTLQTAFFEISRRSRWKSDTDRGKYLRSD